MIKKILTFCVIAFFACSQASAIETAKAQYAGNLAVGSGGPAFELVTGPTVVYDNLEDPSTASTGLAPQSIGAVIGDRVTLADTGYLDAISLSVFNPTDDGGLIVTGDLNIEFFDANTFDPAGANTSLFSVTQPLDFSGFTGGGLSDGFFATVDVTGLVASQGLAATDFTLTNSDILFTQSLTAVTGGSTTGSTIITFTDDNVGSQFMANDNFFLGGAGFVGFAPPTSNKVGATITLTIPEPSSMLTLLLGMGGLGFIRRR